MYLRPFISADFLLPLDCHPQRSNLRRQIRRGETKFSISSTRVTFLKLHPCLTAPTRRGASQITACKGNMVFERTSISAYVPVDNSTCVYKHIFRNLCGQRLAGGLRKASACFLVALSDNTSKRPFAGSPRTYLTFRALSYPSRNNIM